MKKIILTLVSLLSLSAVSMETITTPQQLADKVFTETKLIAAVYTDTTDPLAQPMLDMIAEYEKTDQNVVFLVVPMKDENLASVALSMGVQTIPTTIFSRKGSVIGGVSGVPRDLVQIKELIEAVLRLEKRSTSKADENGI